MIRIGTRSIVPSIALSIALVAFVVGSAAAQGDSITPEAALERLFVSDSVSEDWFAPIVLQQVPLTQLEHVITQIKTGLGAYLGVRPSGQEFLVEFEGGVVPTQIALDGEGRITGLFFKPPRARTSSLDQAVSAFSELPGEVSLVVLSGDRVLARINPDQPLAVGSAFKLAVLAALQDQIESGERSWSDVIALQESSKSLPSGVLHTWPTGSPFTLHTLAAQMISISDNTATDAIIDVVGREAVEALSPRNRPFLKTREAFVLKDPANADLLQRYREAEIETRRTILEETAQIALPGASIFTGDPVALDVEWFMSTRELCSLMAEVQHLDLMTINPGVASKDAWDRVAFKGGSEPGVLNLTTWVTAEDGSAYCVSATWNNDAALDETRFMGLYGGLLDKLNERD